MGTCNRLIFCLMAAATVLMLPPVMLEKIDGKLDVIVVLQHAHTTRNEKYEINAYKKLAEQFEFGEGRAKFGIVFEATKSVRQNGNIEPVDWLILGLTADSAQFNEKLGSWSVPSSWLGPGGTWMPAESVLNRLHDGVFPTDSYFSRRRVVVYIATTSAGNASDTDLLVTKGNIERSHIFFYMNVPNRIDERDNSNPYRVAKFLIYEQWRIFVSPGPDYDARLAHDVVKHIGAQLIGDLCYMTFLSPCHYEEGTRCMIDAEHHSMPKLKHKYINNPKQCDDAPTAYPCTDKNCMDECDKNWPLDEKPDCAGKCGKTINNRRGDPPPGFQNCPTNTINCGTCLTTIPTVPPADTAMIIGSVFGVLLFVIPVAVVAVLLMKKKLPKKGLAKLAVVKGPKKTVAKKKRGSKIDREKGEGNQSGMGSDSGQGSSDADLPKKKGEASGIQKKAKTAKDAGKKKGSELKKKGSELKKKGSEPKKKKKKK